MKMELLPVSASFFLDGNRGEKFLALRGASDNNQDGRIAKRVPVSPGSFD